MADPKTEKDLNWEYDTKCRRCGKINEWYFALKDLTTVNEFLKAIDDRINRPRAQRCNKCSRNTIQDVVSHN